ncbi:MAG: DNA-protecting protein DprA [Pseudomonadota bacterium]|nr:DNA-protecting protein DprA [Pseudomonadota bacterium]
MFDYSLRLLALVLHVATEKTRDASLPHTIINNADVREQCSRIFSDADDDVFRISCAYWCSVMHRTGLLLLNEYPSLPVDALVNNSRNLAEMLYSHLQDCKSNAATVVGINDPLYPSHLRAIHNPPFMLTVCGNVELLNTPKVAIVGSRKASAHALAESYKLGMILARKGYTIVSGGAFGCDIAAHKGVLSTGITPAPAIVVFAGGLGNLHPRRHTGVFRALRAKDSLFISERLWRTPSYPYDFPIRNRIISGLSMSLIVMEASERSGTLVTANLALEQGREIWVLKGNQDDVRFLGSNALISDGAIPFQTANDWM